MSALPDYVADAAVTAAQEGLAALDAARVREPVDPAVSARLRDAIAALFAVVPELLPRLAGASTDVLNQAYAAISSFAPRPAAAGGIAEAAAGAYALATAIGALTRALADALAPDAAVRAMRDLAEAHGYAVQPSYATLSAAQADARRAAVFRVFRLAALTAFAEAVVRRSYASRPDGVNARAEVAARFSDELAGTRGADDAAFVLAAQDLRGRTVDYLTRLSADLAPVVRVSALRPLPSLWWSWRLYADPARAGELVARNVVVAPAFMPREFQALAR